MVGYHGKQPIAFGLESGKLFLRIHDRTCSSRLIISLNHDPDADG